MTAKRVALTGATGFLGRHVVRVFQEAGWTVRILARRDPVALGLPGSLEVVPGDLGDQTSLEALCRGSDLVLHAAGLIKAARDADFNRVNVQGSQRLATAIDHVAPNAKAILVSSLAAREPQLSAYARSKRDAEDAMKPLGTRLIVARPTAIYGPGDQETFQFIAVAARGWPLPLFGPGARLTAVHVDDVARELLALAEAAPSGSAPQAICDDRPEGYSWHELMAAIASAVGRKPRYLRLSGVVLRAAGRLGGAARLFGRPSILSSGKVRELLHPDWTISPNERSRSGYRPQFQLREGLADTVAWAKNHGWLA